MSKITVASDRDYIPPLIRVVLVIAGIVVLFLSLPLFLKIKAAHDKALQPTYKNGYFMDPWGGRSSYQQAIPPDPNHADVRFYNEQSTSLICQIILGSLMVMVPLIYQILSLIQSNHCT